TQGFAHHELVAHALAFVLVVHAGGPPPTRRLRFADLAEELAACFVEAHDRTCRIIGQQVGLDHVLHAPDVLAVRLRRYTPGPDDPRIEVVFFRACRTV